MGITKLLKTKVGQVACGFWRFNPVIAFIPPWWLQDGFAMTLYTAWVGRRVEFPRLAYQEYVFAGAGNVPIFGQWVVPPQAKGTIVATYGITGSLANQTYLHLLAFWAVQRGYGVGAV
jgi:predicted alpha/beta-fold hydrolase